MNDTGAGITCGALIASYGVALTLTSTFTSLRADVKESMGAQSKRGSAQRTMQLGHFAKVKKRYRRALVIASGWVVVMVVPVVLIAVEMDASKDVSWPKTFVVVLWGWWVLSLGFLWWHYIFTMKPK